MPKLLKPEGEIDSRRQYVGAKKAAEIAQVDRVRVLQWLKEGKYPGAFRNSSGYWVIPLEEAERQKREKIPWEWKESKRKKAKPKKPKQLEDLANNVKKEEKKQETPKANLKLSQKRK